MLRPYYLDPVLIVFALLMAVLDYRASVKDLWLPSHLWGEFVVAFCLSLSINISVSIKISPPNQNQTWEFCNPKFIRGCADLLHEIPWTPLESSDEGGRVTWRISTRCDAERNYEGEWGLQSHFSQELFKIFVGSGIFYMWIWLAYLLTTILGTRCQNGVDSWITSVLSTHSFKFIPQGLLPSELIKDITHMNNVTHGQR